MAREVDRGVVATARLSVLRVRDGGALPATVGADWLTTIWDQCAGLGALGPSAMVVEEITGDWLKDIFGLPADASFAITTGCQMAHVTALAAARHHVLDARGWDVREQRARRLAADHRRRRALRHVTVDRALRLLGIGGSQLVVVPADSQGRMEPDGLRTRTGGDRRPGDRVRTGRRGEHGLVRPASGDRRDRARDRCVAPRRRSVRALGGRQPGPAPPRRRRRGRGLVGDRRAQVAQRPVRLRADVLRRDRRAHRVDDDEGLVLRGPGQVGARRGRLDARVVAPRARVHRLRRAALPRARGRSPTSSTAAAISRAQFAAASSSFPAASC